MNSTLILADIGRAVVITVAIFAALWVVVRFKGAPGEEKTLFHGKIFTGILALSMLLGMYAANTLASIIIIGIAYIVCFCVMCRLDKRGV